MANLCSAVPWEKSSITDKMFTAIMIVGFTVFYYRDHFLLV